MITRGKWQGMVSILRFNWPFYAVATAAMFLFLIGLFLISSTEVKWVCGLALGAAVYFLAGSLGVSHLIYDRSDLYRWNWLKTALDGCDRKQLIFCHAGFDDTSRVLGEKFPESTWTILDHFDEERMTEPSIHRARRLFPPTQDTLPACYDRWPVETRSADAVLGILAIHELREETERSAWFSEAKRCLRTGGRVVLVEHLRDLPNFIAFGPGFLHFHSQASWRRSWEAVGLTMAREFRVTPWVRGFVLSSA
jgi:SAM-dependent methyltransferase